MTETVKVTKVFVSDKSKDGKPFISKKGKPYWKVGILTDKYPNVWYSTLAFAQDDDAMLLTEGEEVKIKLFEENGYKNFKLPTRLDELEDRVVALELIVKAQKTVIKEPVVPEISDADLPF